MFCVRTCYLIGMSYNSRPKRFENILDTLENTESTEEERIEAIDDLTELHDEIENWKNGLEDTNFRYSVKFEVISECLDEIEALQVSIKNQETDFSYYRGNVTWPSLY